MSIFQLKEARERLQIVDVRSNREWKGGHVPGARHIFLADLRKRISELDSKQPTAVYCASGYRSSIAASILRQAGFDKVYNVPGSWHAWREAGLPVNQDQKAAA